jgi:hypothetical protein
MNPSGDKVVVVAENYGCGSDNDATVVTVVVLLVMMPPWSRWWVAVGGGGKGFLFSFPSLNDGTIQIHLSLTMQAEMGKGPPPRDLPGKNVGVSEEGRDWENELLVGLVITAD